MAAKNIEKGAIRIGIQGEMGSNSHMAALGVEGEIVPHALLAEVFEALGGGGIEMAVLPIENSLHGSVAEHYDLLLEHEAVVVGERMLRVRHNVIAAPGVGIGDVRRVMSHPVALSQCRRWLRAHPEIEVVPFYDTAGSVKRLMEDGALDTAGIAPELAAQVYGAEVLERGVEDHAENFTRFYVVEAGGARAVEGADKMSVAFSVEHRPGTLMGALSVLRDVGLNLTKIESRPVRGRPWEYVFFVDLRFEGEWQVEAGLAKLRGECQMVKELGRYCAA